MSGIKPGYVVEASPEALIVNGQHMPITGGIDAALQQVLAQLGSMNEGRDGAEEPLRVHLKDHRVGGIGDVLRDVPPETPISMDTFAIKQEALDEDPAEKGLDLDLQPAPESPDHDSIFTEKEEPLDEKVKTPIWRGKTAMQRGQGFSLKSEARAAVEAREARRRKMFLIGCGALALVVLLRVGFSIIAGMGGTYAALCVDARLDQRVVVGECTGEGNPYAEWLYFSEGETIPAVGETVAGGLSEEPEDAGSINREVVEDRGGEVNGRGTLDEAD